MYWEQKDQHQLNLVYFMVNGFKFIDVLLTQCCVIFTRKVDNRKAKRNDRTVNY